MQQQPQPSLVRGRCKCGKRYCIHNARAGVTVTCPNCRRPIPITGADVRAADADVLLLPLQQEDVQPLEAIPINRGSLTLAPEGSRPGLTGKTALNHEEAMLANAQRGVLGFSQTFDEIRPAAARRPGVFIELEPITRGFVHDLFASFYCAGIPRNALNLLVTALALWLLTAVQYVFMTINPWLRLLMIPLYMVVGLYVVQFYWSVLRMTAAGENEIPWVQPDWSLWEDGLRPMLWMLVISALCTAPAWVYTWWAGRAGSIDPVSQTLLLGVGWFFWPVAVMSAALGNSILLVRPDWLARCVAGIGPVYVVAWLAVIIAVGGWLAIWRFTNVLLWIPVAGMAVNLYVGYVVFRTLGLLFRHFQTRFPWD